MDDRSAAMPACAYAARCWEMPGVDKSIANRNTFNTDFQDVITRYA